MKKAKRSLDLEGLEADSSKRKGIGFDSLDEEDEIIDLDDIVELPEEDLKDDHVDGDVELLDADADLDLNDFDVGLDSDADDLLEGDILKEFAISEEKPAPKKKAGVQKKDINNLEADILSDFSLGDEDEEAELGKSSDDILTQDIADDLLKEFALEDGIQMDTDVGGKVDLLDEDFGEEDLFKEFALPEDKKPAPKQAPKQDKIPEKKPAPREVDETAAIEEFESLMDFDDQTSAPPSKDAVGISGPAAMGAVAAATPMGADFGIEAALEKFVAQIEGRLMDVVREVVEARLPEIVRSVIKEEIEHLKKEGR